LVLTMSISRRLMWDRQEKRQVGILADNDFSQASPRADLIFASFLGAPKEDARVKPGRGEY